MLIAYCVLPGLFSDCIGASCPALDLLADLAHFEPSDADTEDVQAAHKAFAALQARWLDELKAKTQTQTQSQSR